MYIHILKTFDDLGTSYQAGQKRTFQPLSENGTSLPE